MPHGYLSPDNLLIRRASGVDDIALTLYPCHEPGIYVLSSLRIVYSAGSTSATVTLGVDHRQGVAWNFQLFQVLSAGGGGSNVNVGIAHDEMKEWYFVCEHPTERDGLSIAQTLGTSDTWALEAAFINAKNL